MVQTYETPVAIPPYQCRFGTFSIAGVEDGATLQHLLRTAPSHGAVRILQTREPYFFADANPLGHGMVLVARSNRANPMLLHEVRDYPVYMDGRQTRALCLRMLRSAEHYRARLGILEHSFLALSGFIRKLGFVTNIFAAIDHDDADTRRIFEAGLKRLPRFIHQGDIHTSILSVDLGESAPGLPEGYTLEQAAPENAQELAFLLASNNAGWTYAPALDTAQITALLSTRTDISFSDMVILRHGGTAAGCIGIWDQRAYRQQWIQGYSPGLGLFRPLRNLWADLRKAPQLPAPGTPLESVYAAFFCLRPSHAACAGALVRRALHHAAQKGATVCALGISPRNPIMDKLPLSAAYSYRTGIYRVLLGQQEKGAPGGFSPQPEIALL